MIRSLLGGDVVRDARVVDQDIDRGGPLGLGDHRLGAPRVAHVDLYEVPVKFRGGGPAVIFQKLGDGDGRPGPLERAGDF